MKKMFILPVLIFLLMVSIAGVYACDYEDHKDCEITKTIVKGRIYFAEDNKSVGNAHVSITCVHNNKSYTQNVTSVNYKKLKGTYFVLFPQEKCIAGDEVYVTAFKDGLSGSEYSTVKNWIDRRCLDIDIAIVNVPLVPEFGLIIGTLTIIGAVGIFFFVRK